MQERHIVVEGGLVIVKVAQTLGPSLFSESDNALPRKLIHSCGDVLVLSASATLAQY